MMTDERKPIRVDVGVQSDRTAQDVRKPNATDQPHQEFLTPSIDIHEEPDGLILEADLPGVSEDSLAIKLEDNVLSLRGMVSRKPGENARLIHQEYRVGEYQRSFILSDDVARSEISAELKNGVLRLCLPKAERAKTRRIEIKSQS
jgi:HSP20 family molecular chaperone IbpA